MDTVAGGVSCWLIDLDIYIDGVDTVAGGVSCWMIDLDIYLMVK